MKMTESEMSFLREHSYERGDFVKDEPKTVSRKVKVIVDDNYICRRFPKVRSLNPFANFVGKIPLIIGVITIVSSLVLGFVYFRVSVYLSGDTLKSIHEIKKFNAESLLDPKVMSSLEDLQKLNLLLPWVICGILLVGLILSVVSYMLIRRYGEK